MLKTLLFALPLVATPAFSDEAKPIDTFTWETSGDCTFKCESSEEQATATRATPPKTVVLTTK